MTDLTTPPGTPVSRWRDQDIEVFHATVLVAADDMNVQPLAVEKDYWVCEALRAITAGYPNNVVFKGGTSLEKLRLIQRFSEDLDLLVIGDLGSGNAPKKALKDMIALAAATTGSAAVDPLSGGNPGSFHRQAYLQPPLRNESAAGVADAKAVLVELGQSGGPQPSSLRTVESLLARALAEPGTDVVPSEWADLAPFEVSILHPGRTLIEKLLRINNFVTRPTTQAGIHGWSRIGRQFYDIWALLGDQDVLDLLQDKSTVREILDSIAEVSQAFTSDEPVPDGGFAASPAFDKDGPFASDLRREHNSAMDNLYYGNPGEGPTFDQALDRVHEHADLLTFT